MGISSGKRLESTRFVRHCRVAMYLLAHQWYVEDWDDNSLRQFYSH